MDDYIVSCGAPSFVLHHQKLRNMVLRSHEPDIAQIRSDMYNNNKRLFDGNFSTCPKSLILSSVYSTLHKILNLYFKRVVDDLCTSYCSSYTSTIYNVWRTHWDTLHTLHTAYNVCDPV